MEKKCLGFGFWVSCGWHHRWSRF